MAFHILEQIAKPVGIFFINVFQLKNGHPYVNKTTSTNIHQSNVDHAVSAKDMDGLALDCGNSSANALELPQSCTKPSICNSNAS